jgi:hypothetical protein
VDSSVGQHWFHCISRENSAKSIVRFVQWFVTSFDSRIHLKISYHSMDNKKKGFGFGNKGNAKPFTKTKTFNTNSKPTDALPPKKFRQNDDNDDDLDDQTMDEDMDFMSQEMLDEDMDAADDMCM